MRNQPDEIEKNDRTMSRREMLKCLGFCGLALSGPASVLSACAPDAQDPAPPPAGRDVPSYDLPTEQGDWAPPSPHTGRLPSGQATIQVQGIGTFPFEAEQVETVRPDIFRAGHFSLFDILVHLSQKGDIALDYHFDPAIDTHVIDGIDGRAGWWYNAYYSAGWFESIVFPMDLFPYKNHMTIRVNSEKESRLAAIYQSFGAEVQRLAGNGGQVVIPNLTIRAPGGQMAFEDVVVTPHDVRSDVLQPGVVTALDAIISLAEQGRIHNLGLTWYERIAQADPVDSYWVEQIDDDAAVGGCGFVYETGPRQFAGFSGTHIHIPADVRVTLSPEYALWFWICLGRGGL